MNYSITEKYNVAVITFKGKVMGGPKVTDFKEDLKEMIESGKTNIVADLSKVTFMNSSGLGAMISALTTLRNAGGDMKLCGASDRIESLLIVTKLITVFDHHKTLDDAVAAYEKEA